MLLKRTSTLSETQKKRSLEQRMFFVHGVLFICAILIAARLMELQVINRGEYHALALSQHYGGVRLPAQRGEIFGLNSKTEERSILATNTTLDLLYIDPLITDDSSFVADKLADILVTPVFHELCSTGSPSCPRELVSFIGSPYAAAFNPLEFARSFSSGALLEPLPSIIPSVSTEDLKIPDITEMRRLFARDIERRVSQKRVTFVPLKYSATKDEIAAVNALNIPGISVNEDQKLVFGNPEELNQAKISAVTKKLAPALDLDPTQLSYQLRSRPLRYIPIFRRLPPSLSLSVKQMLLASIKETNARRQAAYASSDPSVSKTVEQITDPLRSVALLPEHWRFYPDASIASQTVGFLNQNQEPQYGIERTFDAQLRGQEGLISTVSDLQGGQILTSDQTIVNAKDGDSIVLTIDPFVQKEIEKILDRSVKDFQADAAQAIVMDPYTGRIIAMANGPTFDRNNYAQVYEKTPLYLDHDSEAKIVVEIFHPTTNARILKEYLPNVFSIEARAVFTQKVRDLLADVEKMYDLHDVARYYVYQGENARYEVFPTKINNIWLKYKNTIGVGAYLNRTIQEIYEPGSVMKPITMAIAIDQGEVAPDDIYDDIGPVKVDEFEIKNALLSYYGNVSMTDCLAWSINTCMTSVSGKLGRKLFERMITRFGFGKLTGIELEDELSGEVRPWRRWSSSDLATAAFGQGFSATPLHVISAFSAVANGGTLIRPSIVDRIIHPDGSEEIAEQQVIDQVLTPESSRIITNMLAASTNYGFAKAGKVKGYKLAAKTGTSQIAGPGGRYESGTGSTVNTFMGYAPPEHPTFILLVKIDRPKFAQRVFAESTSAPLFKEIATFLYEYYGLPPDEK